MKNINIGVLLLDKPAKISSQLAVTKAKRLYCQKKAGHSGTLDPLATGMLQICFAQATKFLQYFLNEDKTYQVKILLGLKTTTGDAEGELIQRLTPPRLKLDRLNAVLQNFLGDIEQVPPMFSALKHQGKPLYKLARQGIEVERKARRVSIDNIRLLCSKAQFLDLEVRCSKGTYIRTLAMDIAEALGTVGMVAALRRTRIGELPKQAMLTFEQLEELSWEERLNCLQPVDQLLPESWPSLKLSDEQAFYLRRGQPVRNEQVETDFIKVYDQKAVFIGLAETVQPGYIKAKRLIV